ncbi:hypothetical protein AVEN_33290-1, partial [Araneus ventricosus]
RLPARNRLEHRRAVSVRSVCRIAHIPDSRRREDAQGLRWVIYGRLHANHTAGHSDPPGATVATPPPEFKTGFE